MPQFLFVVDMPEPGLSTSNIDGPTRWFDFVKVAKSIALPKGARQLHCHNVWMFPAENNGPLLSQLQRASDDNQLSHSAFLISGDVTNLTKP